MNLIPAPPGIYVTIRYSDRDETFRARVVAFDDGSPMIVQDNIRNLVNVRDFGNDFVCIEDWKRLGGDEYKVRQALPSPGWWFEWIDENDNAQSEPLAGWGVMENGNVYPLVWDPTTGMCDPVEKGMGRIYYSSNSNE